MAKHKCVEQVNTELAKHNTRLVQNLFCSADIFIATERIANLRNGKKAKEVIAAYCPFCGKKIVRKPIVAF